MTRATYDEIASTIVKRNEGLPKNKKFIVCPPSEPDEALTVYPPMSYFDDTGVDLFLIGNTAELRMDGFVVCKLKSIQDADKVATAVIAEIEKVQEERAKEFED